MSVCVCVYVPDSLLHNCEVFQIEAKVLHAVFFLSFFAE